MNAQVPPPGSADKRPETPAEEAGYPTAVPTEQRRHAVTVRRSPKYVPFLILGGLVGFVAAGILAYGGPANPEYTRGTVFGFFAMVFLVPGVLLGALTALGLDWWGTRRSENAYLQSTADADEPVEPRDSPDRDY